jgi:WhiB family transcriptional regulator, redox-sensing transcriptional regulator
VPALTVARSRDLPGRPPSPDSRRARRLIAIANAPHRLGHPPERASSDKVSEQEMSQPSQRRVTRATVDQPCIEPVRRRTARPRNPDHIDPTGRRSPRRLPCRAHDPDLWFAESPADIDRAKVLCATCPVRRDCLAGALRRREPCGVWGGEIVHRGHVIPFKRGRGRPRTHFPPAGDADLATARQMATAQ